MKKALILDYKIGNVTSVGTFLRENGYRVILSCETTEIRNADLLILPGVGSFKTAIDNLRNKEIIQEINARHLNKKATLGICLGFQVLTKTSSEYPNSVGLSIFNGTTTRLKEYSRIGWGKLTLNQDIDLLNDLYFYFNHSFGSYDITNINLNAYSGYSQYHALVVSEKTVGVQFHPERSQKSGNRFLNWLESTVWGLHD
jgi:imidazole glycerol-phosphate synthase subunit HisH